MMHKKEFEYLIKESEGLRLEFKENYDSKNLAKEVVAFANTEGGRIFIGVRDDGTINGIEITNKLKSEIQSLARNCDPSINIQLETIDNILIIDVEEGMNKPYRCSAGFFHRIHFVEKMGTGIKRIRDACEKHGNVKFEVETNGYFISIFRLKKIMNRGLEKTVEKTVEKILALIKDNPKITQEELAEKTGFSRRGIEWNIDKLKEKGIIKRVGPDKGGYWEILT